MRIKMTSKLVYIALLIPWITSLQAQYAEFEKVDLQGVGFFPNRAQIITAFGEPIREYDPEYECGFLAPVSNDQQFTTLEYQGLKFTGDSDEDFVIEQIDFEKDPSLILRYGEYDLSHNTTREELIKIFGIRMGKYTKPDSDSYLIPGEESDDGFLVFIKGEKLVRFEYWTPC